MSWDGDVLGAVEALAGEYRERFTFAHTRWHFIVPPRHFPRVAQLKEEYVRDRLHGYYGLVGFRFDDEWPIIGQVFTYDPVTGEWDR